MIVFDIGIVVAHYGLVITSRGLHMWGCALAFIQPSGCKILLSEALYALHQDG